MKITSSIEYATRLMTTLARAHGSAPLPAERELDPLRQRITEFQLKEQAARLGVEAIEARAGAEVLASADAVFLTNSLIGLRAVGAIDSRQIPGHALIERLDAARLD